MKVLITGGAGFIGSHLCDRFLGDGHEVVCVDNFLSGAPENIAHLKSNSAFTFFKHDVIESLPATISDQKYDAILHFACPASPNPASAVSYMAHPIETLMVTSVGSKNLLDLAVKNDCQIIFASTSEVYGDPLVHPQTEEYWGNVSPNGPRSCYDEGKRFMEALAFAYFRKLQTKIKVIRIFNTYGPRMRLDDGRFIINLVGSGVNNTPFLLYGNGDVTRSFCYVDDLVEGIAKVFATDAMLGQVVNLGNPNEFSLTEAIKIFESLLGHELAKVQGEAQPDDPKRRSPDITKAKTMLDWVPTVELISGLQKTLDYYRRLPANP